MQGGHFYGRLALLVSVVECWWSRRPSLLFACGWGANVFYVVCEGEK